MEGHFRRNSLTSRTGGNGVEGVGELYSENMRFSGNFLEATNKSLDVLTEGSFGERLGGKGENEEKARGEMFFRQN